jgi:ribokinase
VRHDIGGPAVEQVRSVRRRGTRVVLVGAVGDDAAGREVADAVAAIGVEPRLQVHARRPTPLGVTARDADGRSSTVVVPGARLALGGHLGFDDLGPEDVVLVAPGLPAAISGSVAGAARRRGARVVVNASPFAEPLPDLLATADPFVVSERDAALLADVGLIPASLCVTFGRAGAVWDGMRVDSDDLGTPLPADGGTEAFCGALAAGLAAGLDRRVAMREAVAASALTDW